jgi:hypothetical protein
VTSGRGGRGVSEGGIGMAGGACGGDRGVLRLQECVPEAVLQPVVADPAALAYAGGGQGGAKAATCGFRGRTQEARGGASRLQGAAPARHQQQQDLPSGISHSQLAILLPSLTFAA